MAMASCGPSSFPPPGPSPPVSYWPASLVRTGVNLKSRDGYLLLVMAWILVALSAAMPLWLAIPGLHFNHALFEAVAGITTTSSTILRGLDLLPQPINLWRAEAAVDGGTGRHQHRHGRAAAARGRRHAGLSRIGHRPDQGLQADAALQPHRAVAVDDLRRTHGRLRAGTVARRHESLRCLVPRAELSVARQAFPPTTPTSATSPRPPSRACWRCSC